MMFSRKDKTQNLLGLVEPPAWKLCLMLAWGMWWGGLCFYAVVVVPIGTEVIGSVEQGFITQRVTQWHNALTGFFLVGLLIEASRRRSRALWTVGAALAVIEIALIVWHARLSSLMDFQQQTVPGRFYREHAIYLWITATEWLLGMSTPLWLFIPNDQTASHSESKCHGADSPERIVQPTMERDTFNT